MNSIIYDHTDYWPPLRKDLLAAAGSVDIHVPYVTKQGMSSWEPILKDLIKRGVKIRVTLQQPRQWFKRRDKDLPPKVAAEIAQLELLIAWLRAIGATVVLRERIHAKLILIDEYILWEGSLNFLSHFDTTEHLRRSVNASDLHQVRNRHMLHHDNSQPELHSRFVSLMEKRLRELGVTQSDLASALGCKPVHISRVKSGKARFVSPLIEKILEKLGFGLIILPLYLIGPTNKFIDSAINAASDSASAAATSENKGQAAATARQVVATADKTQAEITERTLPNSITKPPRAPQPRNIKE